MKGEECAYRHRFQKDSFHHNGMLENIFLRGRYMKRIIAINAGPRTGWNTDQLIRAAIKGAEEAGAEVEYLNLFKIKKYTGCISCFGCKQEKTYGKCICHDGLYEVLEKIRKADGLIFGSPNYLGNLTASFRALYERLVFQSLTYNKENPCCNTHRIPVLLITTSNCAEEYYDAVGYKAMLDGYQGTLSTFVGPTELFCCGNTLQVKDYSRYHWTMFDPEDKRKHHEETFSSYLLKAEEKGRKLLG